MAVIPFNSVDELRAIVDTLDQAEERPVFVGDNLVEEYKGIWNVGTDALSVIASEGYSLVQHRDAFGLVVDGLDGKEFYGKVYNYHDYVAIEIFFPELKIVDDEEGLDLGIKVVNSYNRSASFKGHATAMRLVCTNGMYLRKIIPDLQFSHIHVGNLSESIGHIFEEFFDNLGKATAVVEDIIQVAMGTFIDFESLDQVRKTYEQELKSSMHAKKVMEYYKAETELSPSKWEFYNAITDYITHADVVPSRVDIYSNWAEKILLPEYEIIPAEMPEVEIVDDDDYIPGEDLVADESNEEVYVEEDEEPVFEEGVEEDDEEIGIEA